MIADIQVLPTPSGTAGNEHEHVEAAIAAIASSGCAHSVHALGTTVEGTADEVWSCVRSAFEACFKSGAIFPCSASLLLTVVCRMLQRVGAVGGPYDMGCVSSLSPATNEEYEELEDSRVWLKWWLVLTRQQPTGEVVAGKPVP